MKIKPSERQFVYILLAALLVLFIILLALSEGFYGGGDNLSHYKYSRYSYLHPEFLLYHWGKPVFTLIMFPFAQFGFTGVQIFNIVAGLISAYLCYLIAKNYNYPNSPIAIILLCFTPIYTIIMMSGMTEILFGLFCILTVYLVLKEKYVLSSIIISFSPLVRTEGIYILPVIGLALLLRKKYRAIPFLFVGFIIYSVIGYFYYKDIFWLITKMPYRGATDLFGTGSILHYVKCSNIYLGNSVRFMLAIGLITFLVKLIRKFRETLDEAVLITLPFLVYFSAHSLMWWSGIGNSDGNHRYMAAIIPFVSLICLKGLNIILNNRVMREIPVLRISIAILFIIFVIIVPFNIYSIPVKLSGTQKVVKECSDWLKLSEYKKKKFYYYDPDFVYFHDFNPYDESISRAFVYKTARPQHNIEPGSIVIWDAHYSPNNNLPLNALMDNPYFRLIKIFTPDNNFKVFGRDYKICVFERTMHNKNINNRKILESISYFDLAGFQPLAFYDFEVRINHRDSLYINNNISYSGQNSIKADSSITFLLTHSFRIADITMSKNPKIISSCKVFSNVTGRHAILLVTTLEHDGKPYDYSVAEFDTSTFKQSDWNILQQIVSIPEPQSEDDIVKVYFWNKSKNEFYVDDFYIGIKDL